MKIESDAQGDVTNLGYFPLLKLVHRQHTQTENYLDFSRRIFKVRLIERGRDNTIEINVVYKPLLRIGFRPISLMVFCKSTVLVFSNNGIKRTTPK